VREVITGGQAQVERLKRTLALWMEEFLAGPWDQAYLERRARIGRRHVEINLPQEYMFTAVNVIRGHFAAVVLSARSSLGDAGVSAAIHAMDRLFDMELAIMLHTYRDDLLARMQRRERLATYGQLMASIAHEIRNPLEVIESSLFLLRKENPTEASVRHLEQIHEQVLLANRIISNLLEMLRERPPVRERIAPRALLESAAASVRAPDGTDLTIEDAIGPEQILVDVDQIRQVLVNLLRNAYEAIEKRPRRVVRLFARREGAHAALLVEDSGGGVDPAVVPRLFEPLVTTKPTGIGLGLALSKKFVVQNGGSVALEPLPDGARFVLRFPIDREDSSARGAP
jgi:signal transduction histidine kinase